MQTARYFCLILTECGIFREASVTSPILSNITEILPVEAPLTMYVRGREYGETDMTNTVGACRNYSKAP